jgi:hypothetical protein
LSFVLLLRIRRKERERWPGDERGMGADPEVPEEDATPPRAGPREQALPWDMRILRQAEAVRPGGAGWDGDGACAKGAVGGSRPDGARIGSADSPTASGNWTAGGVRNVGGRRPNASVSAGRTLRHGRSMPPRNANGVRRPGSSSNGASRQPRPRIARRARGHAERGCQRFSVTGPAATTRRVQVLTHAIAGRRAPLPCVRCRTVNASAYGATAGRVDSNAPRSTKRPASNAAKSLRP